MTIKDAAFRTKASSRILTSEQMFFNELMVKCFVAADVAHQMGWMNTQQSKKTLYSMFNLFEKGYLSTPSKEHTRYFNESIAYLTNVVVKKYKGVIPRHKSQVFLSFSEQYYRLAFEYTASITLSAFDLDSGMYDYKEVCAVVNQRLTEAFKTLNKEVSRI